MAMVSRRRDTFFINPPMEKPKRNANIKPSHQQPPPTLQSTTAESFDMDESSDGETAAVTEPVGGIEVLQIPAQNSYDMEASLTKSEKMFKYIRFIGPHVGLVLLLVVYLLIGATIFHYLEASNEVLTRDKEMRELLALRDHFHDTIWNLTQSDESVISQDSFYGIGREYFDKLVLRTFEACRNQFTNERHLLNKTRETTELLWTYTNSLFFATTVITTIGYGNLVPMTRLGRIACICFALFGIPLLLVTIADIGKFLSDFLNFLYKTYHAFKLKVRKQSRRLSRYRTTSNSTIGDLRSEGSTSKAGSLNLNELSGSEMEDQNMEGRELRIPVVMVLFVLLCYCGIGGLLFCKWEGWSYFEGFYFCFITMATVGFGDIVPTQSSTYIILAYIIFGLSLATMCIDLAGTEYIRKIHYLGSKMEDAKGTVITGLRAGEYILKHRGIEVIRTASGKLIQVGGAMLSLKQARELGVSYVLSELDLDSKNSKNKLYDPPSAAVQRLLKGKNIKIMPNEINEDDGVILQNSSYGKPFLLLQASPNAIHRYMVPADRTQNNSYALLVPFNLKESNI
uniref:Potassium channel domain-containing protein n=1 Tax=Meloidogyne enterolobii TaxID=390850 RepID=A0A6V7UYP3_MELEN|nr:unnamed protein product [Meloidogyne enterolobii]